MGDIPPRVVLMGMMGCGKTSVGVELAHRLGWRFWDNDAEFRARTGEDAATEMRRDGAEVVHRRETDILRDALASHQPTVVCAPGSAALDPAAHRMLTDETTVWLRAAPETLARRVAADPMPRPYLTGDPLTMLTALARQRDPAYAELATLVIDVDTLTVADVADRICSTLALLPAPQ